MIEMGLRQKHTFVIITIQVINARGYIQQSLVFKICPVKSANKHSDSSNLDEALSLLGRIYLRICRVASIHVLPHSAGAYHRSSP